MRTFVFSPQDLDVIAHERFHHPHPRVQQKMEVLWLKSKGLDHTEIAHLTNLGRRTVQRYLTDYLEGGLAALQQIRWKGAPSELARHAASLEDFFVQHPPRSAAEAQATIERLTGIRRGLTQVRAFL